MSSAVLAATNTLREFMFAHVYLNSPAKQDDKKAYFIIETLYNYFVQHPEQLPAHLRRINQQRQEPIERAVVDYIAGMTDRYATQIFHDLFVPRTWGA
jgi:dGTPase